VIFKLPTQELEFFISDDSGFHITFCTQYSCAHTPYIAIVVQAQIRAMNPQIRLESSILLACYYHAPYSL
jgi:hypothetical protein